MHAPVPILDAHPPNCHFFALKASVISNALFLNNRRNANLRLSSLAITYIQGQYLQAFASQAHLTETKKIYLKEPSVFSAPISISTISALDLTHGEGGIAKKQFYLY